MADKKRQDPSPSDRLEELEREAEKTLKRAEELEEKSRELEAEDKELRRKVNEPIGFPPPPPKKGMGR